MSDVYTQESASKKKFLAPLLVILLCMVSLTAAGYAYSATVDNTDDQIVIEGLEMKLTAGGSEVVDAMYVVDDIDLATHVTNGKAIYFSEGTGFKATPSEGTLDYDADTSDLDDFATGYYLEVLKNNAPVGYRADSAYTTKADIEAAPNAYKMGNDDVKAYVLDVNNKSGKNVAVTATTTDLADALAKSYIKSIYIVITGSTKAADAEAVPITDVVVQLTDGEANIPVLAALANNSTATLTVEAYIELSDAYLSNEGYATLLSDLSFDFAVHFEAATA